MDWLNPQQKSASEAPKVPLLIVAGAGTGKTRTLTGRISYFIKQGMSPERICAITFTNKAANEMADRVRDTKNANFVRGGNRNSFVDSHHRAEPFVKTFHSLGAKVLRKEAQLLGRKQNFVIFDNRDSFSLVKKIIKKLFPKKLNTNGERVKKDSLKPSVFSQKISDIKNLDGALTKIKKSSKHEDELLLKVFSLYEERLKENNAFDFDDLIEKTVCLFKKYPEVLKKYQSKFDAILVDEYQDLNPKQYELIQLLASGHKNLSVVGDDEQLIYGWRYADLKIFFGFERDWPGAQIVFLEENYRSTGNIIHAASALSENNEFRKPKKLRTNNPSGSTIKVFEAGDENKEAEWIAEQVHRFRSSKVYKLGNKENETSGTTAILYRTNAQSRALEQALIYHKIPYRIFGGLKFYERREIKDVIASLRYAINKADEISKDRLQKNLSRSKFLELEAALLKRPKDTPPVKLIESFLKSTDYLGYLERNFINYAERQENVGELINFAMRFDSLSQFLEEIALLQPMDPLRQSRETVTSKEQKKNIAPEIHLMTIHLAKGLEFDNVFITGCSEGLLPHARSLGNQHQLEEERRLMYVAMTRAKKDLHISFYDTPSRFLGEIPSKLIESEYVYEESQEYINADESMEEPNITL